MTKDWMKTFLEQAVVFLDDLKSVVSEVEKLKGTTALKKETQQEIEKIYSQFDAIVDWLNKQSKKVQWKIDNVEEMFVWFINDSEKRNRSMQEKMKDELKADITAFWPMFEKLKETVNVMERDIARNTETLQESIAWKIWKEDVKYLEEWLWKTYIDDENISDKTAYSSKKVVEKIDNMINNLRLWGRGKIFIQNEWNDLWQATAINFVGSWVDTTVVNGIHTVTVTPWWPWWSTVWGDITGTLSAQTDLQTALDWKVGGNLAITWATKTKITYDAKGLVTSGADATTADIAPSTDRNYVTDAQQTVISNTSWTNTGDQDLSWLQLKATVVSSNQTAANDWVYVVTASATFTDPTPAEGKGYRVIVRNWTATIWGTWYAVAGSEILRIYHSWAWANYLNTPWDHTTIVWVSGTKAQFDTACSDGNFLYTGDIAGGDATNNIWYLNIPQNSQSAAYTLVLADSWKHIYHPSSDTTARTFTIPANSSVAYPIWTAITFINDSSAGTVTIAITTDTLVLAGSWSTGSRTLAANGVATATKVTSTRRIINWVGLT